MTGRAGVGPVSSSKCTFHREQITSGSWIVFMLRWRCGASGARSAGGVSSEGKREYTQDNGEEEGKCSLRHCVSSVARFYLILMGLSRRRRIFCRRSSWNRRSAPSGEFVTHHKWLISAFPEGNISAWEARMDRNCVYGAAVRQLSFWVNEMPQPLSWHSARILFSGGCVRKDQSEFAMLINASKMSNCNSVREYYSHFITVDCILNGKGWILTCNI